MSTDISFCSHVAMIPECKDCRRNPATHINLPAEVSMILPRIELMNFNSTADEPSSAGFTICLDYWSIDGI